MILPIIVVMVVSKRIEKRIVKVFNHLLATSFLLLHKLAETLYRSIMITCTVRLNIIATIIPGITKQNTPRTVNTETTRPVIRRVERLDKTESSPTLMVTCFPKYLRGYLYSYPIRHSSYDPTDGGGCGYHWDNGDKIIQ